MMDEILAVMPVVERVLLEQELEKSGHGSQVPATSNAEPVTWTPPDLTMSWEYVRPPAASISAGPSSAKKAPRTSDAFMETPIPQRSGAPRFGGSIPEQPEPVQSISPSRGPSARGPSAKTPSKSISAVGRSPQKTSPLAAQSTSISASGVRSKISLFESKGSANAAQTAFNNTQSVSAGKKRARDEDEPPSPKRPSISFRTAPADTSSVSASAIHEILEEEEQEQEEEPAQQTSGSERDSPQDEEQPPTVNKPLEVIEEVEQQASEPEEQPARKELAFSIFDSGSPSHNPYVSPQRVPSASRPTSGRASLGKSIPGAFDEEDSEPESPVSPTPAPPPAAKRATRQPKADVVTSPPPVTRTRTTRRTTPSASRTMVSAPVTQTRASTRPRRLTRTTSENISRNIPGAFVEDDENKGPEDVKTKQSATEDEDTVPPLPSISTAPGTRRTTRKPKVSKGDEEEKKPRVTRRSSRISANGSESPPPEPASPVKRRSSKTSVTATPKKTTRRQR